MSTMNVAALQLPLGGDIDTNIARVSELVREAAGKGAKIILPPELFEGPYFCQVQHERFFATAKPVNEFGQPVRAPIKLDDGRLHIGFGAVLMLHPLQV